MVVYTNVVIYSTTTILGLWTGWNCLGICITLELMWLWIVL